MYGILRAKYVVSRSVSQSCDLLETKHVPNLHVVSKLLGCCSPIFRLDFSSRAKLGQIYFLRLCNACRPTISLSYHTSVGVQRLRRWLCVWQNHVFDLRIAAFALHSTLSPNLHRLLIVFGSVSLNGHNRKSFG